LTALSVGEIAPDQIAAITADHPRLTRAFWSQMPGTVSIQREWTVNLGRAARSSVSVICSAGSSTGSARWG